MIYISGISRTKTISITLWRMNRIPFLLSLLRGSALKNTLHLFPCRNYPNWSYLRAHVRWKFILSKPRRIALAMKKYEMEFCQEFSVTVANGKPRTFIRDFVTLSRLCFKPSSWRTVFTISRTVDQIKVKLCNSFAASLSSPASTRCCGI